MLETRFVTFKCFLLLSALLGLSACGGGSSGDSSSGGSSGGTAPISTTPSPAPSPSPTPSPTPPPPSPPPPQSGSAELFWTAPTQNEDGSALTNLAGYTVRYGKSVDSLDQELDVPGAAKTSILIEGLSAGTWYFTVASYTNTGVYSAPAGPVYRTIG